ncbi:MAG: DNA-binding protein WhiA [Oscillospiraceae bacterium]
MSFNEIVVKELIKNNFSFRNCCNKNLIYGLFYNVVSDSQYIEINFRYDFLKNEFENFSNKTFGINQIYYQKKVSDEKYIYEKNVIYKDSLNINDFKCENCYKHFIVGYFLINGYIQEPKKGYKCEISFKSEDKLDYFKSLLVDFNFNFKFFKRKRDFLLYTYESTLTEDFLTFMSATNSSLKIMNMKIYKGIRNNVNRLINFETANISKTIEASRKQINDIKYIVETKGWDYIPDDLIEMALLRFQNPEMTLSEMDKCLSKPIGRSALNNRLKKLSRMAATIKDEDDL